MRALSVRNPVRSRPKPEIKPGTAGVMLVMDQNVESSQLLVDHLWDQFEPQLPGETIAAVPARDTSPGMSLTAHSSPVGDRHGMA